VTYQWGKPQLDEVENAEGAVIPMDTSPKKDHPGRPGAEEKHTPCYGSEMLTGSYQRSENRDQRSDVRDQK